MPSLFLGQSFWTVHLQPQLCEKCKNGDIWLNMIVLWLKIMTNTDPQLAAAGAVLQRPLLGSGRAERARCCPGGSAPPAAAAARPRLRSWGREQPVTLLTPPRTYHLAGKPEAHTEESGVPKTTEQTSWLPVCNLSFQLFMLRLFPETLKNKQTNNNWNCACL